MRLTKEQSESVILNLKSQFRCNAIDYDYSEIHKDLRVTYQGFGKSDLRELIEFSDRNGLGFYINPLQDSLRVVFWASKSLL